MIKVEDTASLTFKLKVETEVPASGSFITRYNSPFFLGKM